MRTPDGIQDPSALNLAIICYIPDGCQLIGNGCPARYHTGGILMAIHPSTGNERLKIRQYEVALLIVADGFVHSREIENCRQRQGQGIQLVMGDEG